MTPRCPDGWTPPTAAEVCALLEGRTQAETAAALGVTVRHVRRWMKGEARVNWPVWYTMSRWVRDGAVDEAG